MGALIGEYECKLDEKGRLMLPSGLKKQLPPKEQKKFVINRGFEKQLNLYPQKEWEKITSQINELNLFVKQNREFVRKFNNGATEVEVDGSGRVLLPKTLMQYAGIDKEAILFAHSNRIEIWSKAEYDKFMKEGADDFAALAEQVMGNIPTKGKEMYHKPALLEESIEGLNIKEGGIYVDATFGGGGHANAILERLKGGKLFVFDQDTDAIENSKKDKNLYTIHANFRYMKEELKEKGITKVDGILADLGISSHQIDTPGRGFSTRFDAPLDMRINTTEAQTAADIINSYSISKLTLIFSEYGEIANAHRLAHAIDKARKEKTIHTTSELIEAIKDCTPKLHANKYLAKVFQALRLELNEEMDALKDLLKQSAELLNVGGRLAVISYHSLEDRLVKNYMRAGNFEGIPVKNMYGHDIRPFNPITRKPIIPSEKEIESNSRARSAKLRIAEKTA